MSSFYLDSVVSAEKRLNDSRNVLNEVGFKTIGNGKHSDRGDKTGTPHRKLSPETKGLISALAQVSGVKETAKSFGLNHVTASNIKRGLSTDGQRPDPEVREKANSFLDTIAGKATGIVQNTLDILANPDRLANAKTTEVAQIASIAMGILEKTQPKRQELVLAGRICFMVPPARTMDDYDIIDVDPVRE